MDMLDRNVKIERLSQAKEDITLEISPQEAQRPCKSLEMEYALGTTSHHHAATICPPRDAKRVTLPVIAEGNFASPRICLSLPRRNKQAMR